MPSFSCFMLTIGELIDRDIMISKVMSCRGLQERLRMGCSNISSFSP